MRCVEISRRYPAKIPANPSLAAVADFHDIKLGSVTERYLRFQIEVEGKLDTGKNRILQIFFRDIQK